MRRRTFLASGAAFAATAGCRREETPIAAPPAAESQPAPAPPAATSERPLGGLDLMADAVLPGGGALPGALEAGVDLERALSDPSHRNVAELLRKGTDRLASRLGRLSTVSPQARLDGLQLAIAEDSGFPWAVYRDALVDFTVEAWAGHPGRAGNRGGRVWQTIRLMPDRG